MTRVNIYSKCGRAKKKPKTWSKGSPGENEADNGDHYDHDYDDHYYHDGHYYHNYYHDDHDGVLKQSRGPDFHVGEHLWGIIPRLL